MPTEPNPASRDPAILIPAIVKARKDRGWTQAQLAQVMGVSRSWWADIEAGGRQPGIGVVEKAMRALGLTIAQVSRSDRDTTTPRP